jgi:hypothetical protein
MAFGFSDDKSPVEKKQLDYKLMDVLKYTSWTVLKSGRRVQSILTGNKGVIDKTEDLLETVYITWDSGKTSKMSKSQLTKVILLPNEEDEASETL